LRRQRPEQIATTTPPADRSRSAMTELSRHINATPERVFAELSDGWIYASWVVGASHIRAVDAAWPDAGARLQHRVGPWPLSIADFTEVLEVDAPNRLVLQARAWPFGEARVRLTLRPDAGGSQVSMKEVPTNGPGRVLDNPLQRVILRRRNRESLARLAALAENRPRPGAAAQR
jgi:uncharacterized protein YndB with AHSA1/START domain